MHSPLSTQALAHLRDISGPSPVRTMSRTPAMVARGSAVATPAGSLMGQASKHLPQAVQASSIASTRAARAASKVSGMMVLRHGGTELYHEGMGTNIASSRLLHERITCPTASRVTVDPHRTPP